MPPQKYQLEEMLEKHVAMFTKHPGQAIAREHRIPFKRDEIALRESVENDIKAMLDNGIIKESHYESSAVVIKRKREPIEFPLISGS